MFHPGLAYSLLLELATFAYDGGSDGVSSFDRLAGVVVGLLLFSDMFSSDGIDDGLRLFDSNWEILGEPDRELLLLPFDFVFFFTSTSESLLFELGSLDESVL